MVYPLKDVRLLAPLPEPCQISDYMMFEEHLKNAFAQAEKLTGRTRAIPHFNGYPTIPLSVCY